MAAHQAPRPWDSPGKNIGVGCHFLLQCMKVKSESEVTQSCPTLSDPMDCNLPVVSIHGIFRARVLEWVAIAFSELDSILKSRDITLLTKVVLVESIVFPIVMHGCESWTKRKAERWRIDAFELWCWKRLLRIPWTARRSNQSILKEISPEYSLEYSLVYAEAYTLATWCKEMTLWKRPNESGKRPNAGKGWRQEEKGKTEDKIVGWHHWLDGHEFEQALGVSDGLGSLACCSPWDPKELNKTELPNWCWCWGSSTLATWCKEPAHWKRP